MAPEQVLDPDGAGERLLVVTLQLDALARDGLLRVLGDAVIPPLRERVAGMVAE